MDGNVLNRWEQGTTSDWGWRDLAFDGTFLYGSDADTVVQIDPATGAPTGVGIPCPLDGVSRPGLRSRFRSLLDGRLQQPDRRVRPLWVGYSTSFTNYARHLWRRLGSMVARWPLPVGVVARRVRRQARPPSLTHARAKRLASSLQASRLDSNDNIAGGATILSDHPDFFGQVILAGMHQADSDTIVGYDLGAIVVYDATWLSERPAEGTVAAGATQAVAVTFDATLQAINQPGEYYRQAAARQRYGVWIAARLPYN